MEQNTTRLELTSLDDFEFNDTEPQKNDADQYEEEMDFPRFAEMVSGSTGDKVSKGLLGINLVSKDEENKIMNVEEEWSSEDVILNLNWITDPQGVYPFVRLDVTVRPDKTKDLFDMHSLVRKYISRTHDIEKAEKEEPTLIFSICPRRPIEFMLKFGLWEMQLMQPVFSEMTASAFGKQSDTLSLLFVPDMAKLLWSDCSTDENFSEELKQQARLAETEMMHRTEEEERKKRELEQKEQEFLMKQEEFRKKNAEMISFRENIRVGRGEYDPNAQENEKNQKIIRNIYDTQNEE